MKKWAEILKEANYNVSDHDLQALNLYDLLVKGMAEREGKHPTQEQVNRVVYEAVQRMDAKKETV